MRIANWNPKINDAQIYDNVMDRLEAAGNVIARNARKILQSKIGKGKTTGISHGVYKRAYTKGKYHYTGAYWTSREFGSLLKTIRVVRKYGDPTQNVWVMAGNKKIYYAQIVEFYMPFLRLALSGSKTEIKTTISQGTTAKGGTF